MLVPRICGVIRRRLLINYRIEPDVAAAMVPVPFSPKLQNGFAIAGVCLIRLEQVRPRRLPAFVGVASENSAHRIAVTWRDAAGVMQEGVYIPRRDTNSLLNGLAGGRIFPGEHHRSKFHVEDSGGRVAITVRNREDGMSLDIEAAETDAWPTSSCFESLSRASAFFESGSLGYSATRGCCRLDGLELRIDRWKVRPLAVNRLASSFFDDEKAFPAGSIAFDHALLMRDVDHEWLAMPALRVSQSRESPSKAELCEIH